MLVMILQPTLPCSTCRVECATVRPPTRNGPRGLLALVGVGPIESVEARAQAELARAHLRQSSCTELIALCVPACVSIVGSPGRPAAGHRVRQVRFQ